ncbi:oxidoreductase domain protein [Clostridium sp. DL-VIII]|uniref:Gfo/Idh/MocA family protein n=1 Tax=Clostridium sp. DL-VIII TaxID=641107 RepID=UPI00023B0636|nr:Gfo/Idh/MocA family oxidoreductase [Clostridium sp. DL-VIII]EHJ01501.1 oxidoreductase domain protein [Clostridium sp. DL-VIII]
MENKYNVLIVGAGNIGAFFDKPLSMNILTHAHAFSNTEKFNLLGFIDLDRSKAEEASVIWTTSVFESLEDAFRMHTVDIISMCVPDNYHYEILKKVLNFPVKLVFAEKPLAKTLEEAKEIRNLYYEKGTACLINYSRRFVPEFEEIRNEFFDGKYGKFITGSGYYGKGVLHNGSHMVDFLRYILGEITTTQSFNYNYDFYEDDPSISAIINFKNGGIFTMMNVPCNLYTIFELELLFERKKIKIKDSGFKIEVYDLADSTIFKGYKNLLKKKEYNSSLGRAMENAVDNIWNYMKKGEKLKCTLEDGFKAMKICEKLRIDCCNE